MDNATHLSLDNDNFRVSYTTRIYVNESAKPPNKPVCSVLLVFAAAAARSDMFGCADFLCRLCFLFPLVSPCNGASLTSPAFGPGENSKTGSSRSTGWMTRFGCQSGTSWSEWRPPERGGTRRRSFGSLRNALPSSRHWTRPCLI